MLDQVIGHLYCHIYRHGKTIAGVGTRTGKDGGVDAHQFPTHIHQGSA